jgi:tight adherence protein B
MSYTPLFGVGVSAVMAVAVALLAWSLLDIGINGVSRYRRVFTDQARLSLRELFLFVDPGQLFILNMATATVLTTLAWVTSGSLVLGLVTGTLIGMLPRFALHLLRQRRLQLLDRQLPDALLMLAGSMKAGASLTLALQHLGPELRPPLSQELALLLREQRLGVSLDLALDSLDRRVGLPSIALSVCAIRIASETGGQLAETLERTSHALRSKLAMEQKIRALTSQGKLQAIVVGSLPLLVIAVLYQMEPEAMRLLFTTEMGWATLATIAVLELAGVVIIRKIVNIDV